MRGLDSMTSRLLSQAEIDLAKLRGFDPAHLQVLANHINCHFYASTCIDTIPCFSRKEAWEDQCRYMQHLTERLNDAALLDFIQRAIIAPRRQWLESHLLPLRKNHRLDDLIVCSIGEQVSGSDLIECGVRLEHSQVWLFLCDPITQCLTQSINSFPVPVKESLELLLNYPFVWSTTELIESPAIDKTFDLPLPEGIVDWPSAEYQLVLLLFEPKAKIEVLAPGRVRITAPKRVTSIVLNWREGILIKAPTKPAAIESFLRKYRLSAVSLGLIEEMVSILDGSLNELLGPYYFAYGGGCLRAIFCPGAIKPESLLEPLSKLVAMDSIFNTMCTSSNFTVEEEIQRRISLLCESGTLDVAFFY